MAFGEPQLKDTERLATEMLFMLGIMHKGIKVMNTPNLPGLEGNEPYNTISTLITLENGQHVTCKVNWEANALPQTVIRQMMHAIAFTFTVACRDDGQAIWDAVAKFKKGEIKKRNNGHEHNKHSDTSSKPAEGDPGSNGKQDTV